MTAIVEHFGCKGCGGTLGVREGERVVTCEFCGVRNMVIIEDHVPQYTLAPVVKLDEAKRKARNLINGSGLAGDLPVQSRFHDAHLYYLPHYELTGVRTGKMVQIDVKQVDSGYGHTRTVESQRANVLMSDVYVTAPAAKLGDWGIENVPLEKQRQMLPIKPFDPGHLEKDAIIFHPNITPQSFEDQRSSYEGYMPGDQTKIVQKTFRMIYSPVWSIKYTYHNRLYRIVIDAVLGEVLFARAPAGDMDRIPLMLFMTLFFTYPFARFLRYLYSSQFRMEDAAAAAALGYVMAVPALIILCVAVIALAFAWNQFRYSGEVVWRGDVREVERVNKPPDTAIERYARAFTSIISSGLEGALKMKANRWYD